MSPKNMSSNESSADGENIVLRLKSNENERNANISNQSNGYIKFKLDETIDPGNFLFLLQYLKEI